MRSDNKEIGLKRMKIVDIQTSSNIEEDTNNLIANAIVYARKQGVHILELMGFGKNIREQALKTNPYIRTLSYSPFFSGVNGHKIAQINGNKYFTKRSDLPQPFEKPGVQFIHQVPERYHMRISCKF